MKSSDEELNIIYKKRPDLRRKLDLFTNNAIIEFLRKCELVFNFQKFQHRKNGFL